MGSSVDWLDVYVKLGAPVVAQAIASAAPVDRAAAAERSEQRKREREEKRLGRPATTVRKRKTSDPGPDERETEPAPDDGSGWNGGDAPPQTDVAPSGDDGEDIGNREAALIRYAADPIDAADAWRAGRLIRKHDAHRDYLARKLLVAQFAPPESKRPGETWMVARHAGVWWVRPASSKSTQKWIEIDEEAFDSRVGQYLSWLWREAPTKEDRDRILPLAPSGKMISDMLKGMVQYTYVRQDTMPCWLPAAFTAGGVPTWETRVSFERVEDECLGPVPANYCVGAQNGIFDVQAFLAGEWRMMPPSPRFFNATCLPFSVPVDEMRAADEDASEESHLAAFWEKKCPVFMGFLKASAANASPGHAQAWIDRVQEAIGYVNSWYRDEHAIIWIQGFSGSGKDVLASAFEACVGADNVAVCRPENMGGRFELAPMVGKMMYYISEFRIDPSKTNTAALQNVLNSISGNVKQRIEDKNVSSRATSNVQLGGCFVVTSDQMPKMRDDANAWMRRLVVIPFEPYTGPEDKQLKQKIAAEAPWIFCWGLYGLRRLIKQGGFTKLQEADEILSDIGRTLAPIKGFVEDCCVLQEKSAVSRKMLRELFCAWAREAGESWLEDISAEEFSHKLRAGVRGIKSDKQMRRINGVAMHLYHGIRPLTDAELEARASDSIERPTWRPGPPMVISDWYSGVSQPSVADQHDGTRSIPYT